LLAGGVEAENARARGSWASRRQSIGDEGALSYQKGPVDGTHL